jgi:hypothetical protein
MIKQTLIENTVKSLTKMTNREIAELLVKNGIYIIPKDKKCRGVCRK